jgi:hypothetical protein
MRGDSLQVLSGRGLRVRQMGALFNKNTCTIGLHIRNIFKEGELEEAPTQGQVSRETQHLEQRALGALFSL